MSHTTDKLLTLKQVAEICQVKYRTVRGWVDRGELKASNCTNRLGVKPRLRVRESQLDAFLKSREVVPTEVPARTAEPRKRRFVENVPNYFKRDRVSSSN